MQPRVSGYRPRSTRRCSTRGAQQWPHSLCTIHLPEPGVNRSFPHSLAIVAFAVLTHPWAALASADGLEMHRLQAGELDATGWAVARSTYGRFSVSLPGKFNDYSVKDKAKDGTPQTAHTVGMKTPSGIRVVAMTLVREDGRVDSRFLHDFDKAIAGTVGARRLTQAGMPGVEIVGVRGRVTTVLRAFAGTHQVYLLSVEYPNPAEPEAKSIAPRFMASFKPLD